jgi:hypothetical protein
MALFNFSLIEFEVIINYELGKDLERDGRNRFMVLSQILHTGTVGYHENTLTFRPRIEPMIFEIRRRALITHPVLWVILFTVELIE